MRYISLLILSIGITALLSSCDFFELDNYEGPDAGLSGAFIDAETGELVPQDIIRGTEIELIEHGYDPVQAQYLNAKTDGTYSNQLLFANTYDVQPVRGNFIPIESQEVDIEGDTELDFEVTPYIRVLDAEFEREGIFMNVTFSLEQTVESEVSTIGLYVHPEPHVGEPMHDISEEVDLDRVVDEEEEFELSLPVATLDEGQPYFFRVGALIDEDEAKFNYAPTEKIEF